MIAGLDNLLETSAQPGLTELRGLLEDLFGQHKGEGRVLSEQILQPPRSHVFRLSFALNGQVRSVVVKRLKTEVARRSELVAERWLPAIGLSDSGPPLLGRVAESRGTCVWHVYDDLGPYELDSRQPDRESIRAAIELIARMHRGFAEHALLGEVRLHGGDRGIHFYEANVRDAVRALEACQPGEEHHPLRDRLLQRLYKLRGELPRRAQALEEWSGPETLLHGDLWAVNVFIIPGVEGLRVRLVDWDRVAVGPASYDLSTFLLRFPLRHRSWILDAYAEEVARVGWRLPPRQELNLLFETAEYARFANRVIWAAISLVQDQELWGWDELAEVDRWFENFEPVLPREQGTPATSFAQQ